MEVRILRYFLAVAREENITKAAEILHITQPTLSRQLNQLEEEVGVRLFERGSRKIVLTNEGLLLRRRAEEIIALVDKTERELIIQEEVLEGTISIGCGELQAVQVLPELFRSFSEKYPQVNYDLFTANADQVKEQMEAGILDIGLLLEPINIDKYNFIRLPVKERWVVLMRPDDPLAQKEWVTAQDLERLPIIMARRSNVQNELANWFGSRFQNLHILFKSNFSTNAAIMVQDGQGYALIVEGVTGNLWDQNKICSRPLYPELLSTCVLAWKRQQPFSKATTKFLEHIKSVL
ncbi:MAG: LysR family transcriptional regulator [Lachnoclostridium edouardi]|uniref:LysR family transcriptional regulator n=1 Tax=Lachnoclostridium edouardi TaxID=1926283 RepID=UPI0026DB903D|nr:LysR family transcriptional regulator [Lachnoclostridium edouardi]MDO4279972.1 LysR family transcriptional regulator [Lachnoclostridium edouardi]